MKEGPQNFCREHKRAGMYTNRNGLLLVATRDGSGKPLALHALTYRDANPAVCGVFDVDACRAFGADLHENSSSAR